MGADSRDFQCPISKYSKNIGMSRELFINNHSCFSTGDVKEVPDGYLIEKLVEHVSVCHSANLELIEASKIIREQSGIKLNTEHTEKCKRKKYLQE